MDPLTVSTPVSVRDPWARAQASMQIPESPSVTTESGSRHRTQGLAIFCFLLRFLLRNVSNLTKVEEYSSPHVPISQIKQLSTFCQTLGICIFNKQPGGSVCEIC